MQRCVTSNTQRVVLAHAPMRTVHVPMRLIAIPFERNDTGRVVATCTFYQTRWYECIDVSDCRRGNNHCRGGTPWRGYYTGTITEGFQGNITAKAINNAATSTSGQPQDSCVTSASALPLLYYCRIEKNENVRVTWFRFHKECCSGTCRTIIVEEPNPPSTMKLQKDDVVKSLDGYPGMDATVYCYFYEKDEFNCAVSRHYTDTTVAIEALRCKYADHCLRKQCPNQKQS
ncbi:hypothetical protein BV898_15153 [Hypsibius exemplaris]|uniref:Uncharacterized protein n=1 Tax=Hypsibius exemplaris TaxID=2072580 RepID=A0A9X6RJZ1_HYPEX|nr:hypothetical protein BV898_15153 [Hypsibius exemplaris]